MNASEPLDLTFFVDKDNSPFILFSAEGSILYLNDAAEILLGYTDRKTLYELALAYAPHDFGSRTTVMDLHYRQLNFYALQVAYADEKKIGLRLYYRPRTHRTHTSGETPRLQPTNINTILEAAITLFSLEYTGTKLDLLTDTDLPDFLLDQNAFSRLLRKCLHLFRTSTDLHIRLSIAIGESMRIDATRYPIVRLQMQAQTRHNDAEASLRQLAADQQILLDLDTNAITLDIPFIQSDQMPKI